MKSLTRDRHNISLDLPERRMQRDVDDAHISRCREYEFAINIAPAVCDSVAGAVTVGTEADDPWLSKRSSVSSVGSSVSGSPSGV
ncbi:hypothetical protein [Propionivibrio dicarboxylicus]|uniref:hypothetical protein n=1 Tax=Propionivibrio dicarboxylicus TaxID=83767 RepID=UPI00115F9196|nr:hypothetical protein [Propionivibrio dicarboxylicus]